MLSKSWWLIAALAAAPVHAEMRIFACEPEWGALARELVPDATIEVATTAAQDPHYVQARPSLIAKMRRADVAICTGAELEIGWLPALLMKANNSALSAGGNGLFFAADQVDKLDVLAKADRSMGDVHAAGNPHIHLSPQRIEQVAVAFAARLGELAPDQAEAINTRLADFQQRWHVAEARWEQQGQGLKGMQVVAYHSSFRYLFDWLGVVQIGDLEPKPGLPPTSGHLTQLLAQVKGKPLAAVIHTPYQEAEAADWLSKQTGVPEIELPFTVDDGKAVDLFALYDQILATLVNLRSVHAVD